MINGSAVLLRTIQAVAALLQNFRVPLATVVIITYPLNQNADTGSLTEEYEYELDDVDDNTRSPVSVNSNTAASATVVPASASASCDVCLDAPRVKVALVPCEHATFCQQCIVTLVVTISHCPVCRGVISSTV